ncbi:hypothetical protein CUP0450 [Campylobacter upsaliensis RM3195]|nr:hypothetical protein CUP0450 [Campylobacter upsaliensis RM3195]
MFACKRGSQERKVLESFVLGLWLNFCLNINQGV